MLTIVLPNLSLKKLHTYNRRDQSRVSITRLKPIPNHSDLRGPEKCEKDRGFVCPYLVITPDKADATFSSGKLISLSRSVRPGLIMASWGFLPVSTAVKFHQYFFARRKNCAKRRKNEGQYKIF